MQGMRFRQKEEQLPDGYITSAGDGECVPCASAGSPGTRDEIFSVDQNQFHLSCIMEKALLVEGHEGLVPPTSGIVHHFFVRERKAGVGLPAPCEDWCNRRHRD